MDQWISTASDSERVGVTSEYSRSHGDPLAIARGTDLARAVAAAVIASLLISIAAARSAPQREAQKTDLSAIVGADDGYGLVLTASSDGKGSLEMCGCGRTPLGGLPRRVGYELAVLGSTGGQAGLVRVDAGGAFDDTIDTGRNEVIPHIRNEWVLRGYEARDFAAINVAPSDLRYLSPMNIETGRETRAERFPMLDRVVSANVVPDSSRHVRFQPFVIRQVKVPRLGSTPLRVGIIGVCWPGPDGARKIEGYRIEDPIAAVKAVVPELRKRADVIVLMSYGPMAKATLLAESVPGLDVVLAANTILPETEAPSKSGQTIVAPVVLQARTLTEVRGWRAKTGAWTFAPRSTRLDDTIPSDPETLTMVHGARVDYIR